MDKYFIQNAFKTLDEIEEEMANDKKSLKESLSLSEDTRGNAKKQFLKELKHRLEWLDDKEKEDLNLDDYAYNTWIDSDIYIPAKWCKDNGYDPDNIDDDGVEEYFYDIIWKEPFKTEVKKEIEKILTIKKESLSEDTTAVEEPMDRDEFEDKYLGKMAVVGGNGNFKGSAVQITKLIDFNGDFEKSVWEGVTEDGLKLTLAGDELEVKLEEKLPRDLAGAYRRITSQQIKNPDSPGRTMAWSDVHIAHHFPVGHLFRKNQIDFENSNYKDITHEDRDTIIDTYKKKKYQLRLLYKPDDDTNMILVMWDKDGRLLTSPSALSNVSRFRNGEISRNSFKDLVTAADKIYVTDEEEHRLPLPRALATQFDAMSQEEKDNWELLHTGKQLITYDTSNPYYGKNKKMADLLSRAIDALDTDYYNHLRGDDIPDTGKHRERPSSYADLAKARADYAAAKDNADADAFDVKRKRIDLNTRQWNHNDVKAIRRHYFGQRINHDLAKLIILKAYAKKLRQEYKEKRDDAEKSSDVDIRKTTWAQLSSQKELIETRIQNLTEELLKYQKQLADVNNQLTPEAQQEFEDIVDSKLDAISAEYENVVAQIEQLTKRKPVTEDLGESYLRIYTRDFDGKEDFVDDFDTVEEAKERFQDLMDSGDFEQVCLVSINKDDVEVICDSCDEEGDCDITECAKPEKLTEGKSFNLKDSDDIINAQAYRAVGDHKDDDLVVVDPSVESMDDEFAPHVGDAILQCPSCKTTFFLDPDKLEKDEESDKYNLEMPCPHCGAKGGFDYLFQAADKDSLDAEKESSEEQKAEPEDKLEPVEDDLVDVDDVDEIKEESFEKLVNPYLTKLYENVKGFKVTNVSMPHHNQIIVEGNLRSFSGKEKLVEFVLNATKKKDGKVILEGFNTKLTGDSKNAYTLTANMTDNNLIFESFNYKYTKNIGGQNILIEGVEK